MLRSAVRKNDPYRLAIVDFEMPGLNGEEQREECEREHRREVHGSP